MLVVGVVFIGANPKNILKNVCIYTKNGASADEYHGDRRSLP